MKKLLALAVALLCIPLTAQVSVSINVPLIGGQQTAPIYGWNLIPGATRRIFGTSTGGATNTLTWAVTSTAGGASATLVASTAPNQSGNYVDLTLGAGGANCTFTGASGTFGVTSTAQVVLTATSVDDVTKTASTAIDVCSPTVAVYASPFNSTLYQGQQEDVQSSVWGTVDKAVTWAIATQPAGGNGILSDTAMRDVVFSATVTGEYDISVTSVADPTKNAHVMFYVTPNPLPAYAYTPNHTRPVDCSVDPALTGGTYDVGFGKPYATIKAVNDFGIAHFASTNGTVRWPAGSTIRLFNTDLSGTAPSRFPEYMMMDGSGTYSQPVRIVGCPDASGNLPVMDGVNATAYTTLDGASNLSGTYQIGIRTPPPNQFHVYPFALQPQFILVEGLAFRNAYPGLGTYTPSGGTTAVAWPSIESCIRPFAVSHVTMRGNDMQDCAEGTLADFNGNNNAWAGLYSDIDIEGNYYNNLGNTGGSVHEVYTQGWRQVIQGNYFGALKSTSSGGLLKMRGVDDVVRYNIFTNSYNTRMLDMVEAQDSTVYMSFKGYLYNSAQGDFHNTYPADAYTADLLATAEEAYHSAYVYGNKFNFVSAQPPSSASAIHFYGDQAGYTDSNLIPIPRVGTLYAYSNSIYHPGGASTNVIDTQLNGDNNKRAEWPSVAFSNNAVYVGPLDYAGGKSFVWTTLRSDFDTFTTNYISSYWGTNTQTCTNNSLGACNSAGWTWKTETTQYLDGLNLPAHISGFANVTIGGTAAPFDNVDMLPPSGSPLNGAATALPAAMASLPVRFQKSAINFTVMPRTLATSTLGAMDGSAVAVPTLTFAAISAQTYGVAPFTVSATSASSGAVTYSVGSGPATVSGNTVTITAIGTVVLNAAQAASGNYSAASATTSFIVNPGDPALAFVPIPSQTSTAPPFTVSTTTKSSGSIAYSVVSGPATIAGNTVTLTGAVGTVNLQASQAASGNYTAATATTSFAVTSGTITPVLTFTQISAKRFPGSAPFAVSATSASPGSIVYSVQSGPATISGQTVTLTGKGTVTLRADQAATSSYTAATTTISFLVK